jgi:hypothetical protein
MKTTIIFLILLYSLNACALSQPVVKPYDPKVLKLDNTVTTYGLKGDGITDDTKAIQYLLDTTTGTVILPAGNYLISSGLVLNRDNITLKGDGRNTATQLVCAGFFDAITVNGMRCMIDGVAVDGNRRAKNGIVINGTQSEIQNCFIQNCLENGIYLPCDISKPSFNKNISKCKIYTCVGAAILSETTDLYIQDCEIANNEGDVQVVLAGANNRIINSHIWSGCQYKPNPKTVGVEIRASMCYVVGCVFDRNNSFGLTINPNEFQKATSTTIIGNTFFENGGYTFYKFGVSGIIEIGNSYN